jgi:hypothetical protein
VHQPRVRRDRSEGDMRGAVSGGLPVRLPVRGIDDDVGPGVQGQCRDVVAAPDVKLAPVGADGWRGARVEGGDDAVTGELSLARDPQPEKAAAADHEKVHQGTVMQGEDRKPSRYTIAGSGEQGSSGSGGPAREAKFEILGGATADSYGNVVFTDTGGGAVWVVAAPPPGPCSAPRPPWLCPPRAPCW